MVREIFQNKMKIKLIWTLVFVINSYSYASVTFPNVFAPQQGLVTPVEQPWRQEICLNGLWEFQPMALPENYDIKNGTPVLPDPVPEGWSKTPIRIPSPWNVNAFGYGSGKTFPSYPSEWEQARMGWLRHHFKVPAGWNGKRLILHFEAVCGYVQVLVNGQLMTEHFDNSLPFAMDITDFVNMDGDNELLLGIRQASLFDIPGTYGKITYPSGSPWNRQMIGVWQDVFLQALPPLRVEDIAIRPLVDKNMLELVVKIRNNTPQTQDFDLGGQILPWISNAGRDFLSAPEPNWTLGNPVLNVPALSGTIGPRMTSTITLQVPVKNELNFWTPDTPNLYGLVLDIVQNQQTSDRCYERFGWRQWSIDGRNVILNGKPIVLLGDADHLLGVQYLTRRYAWSWYHALKMANGNAIRLHATIRPRFYLDLADEMGIAILDESDIYNSTTDINYYAPETWLRFGAHIDGMVERDRNYASVFGWSIANEVLSALWWIGVPRNTWQPIIEKSVALADRIRSLDPTRPWISSDGDGDFHGHLPTYVYHYGTPTDWKRNAPKDKPFGIGEGGSMLWGSPLVFSAYNGDRSFESLDGTMDGIARECYHYLVEQRKVSAYTSLFTFIGVSFNSQQLGKSDKTKAGPAPEDGINFGTFIEGRPGIQPERLPSYQTFNPGYDPSLPLFDSTIVYSVFKAAYAPEGPKPCDWDHFLESPVLPAPPAATISKIGFAGDPESNLKIALESCGLSISKTTASMHEFLVIDGATLKKEQIAKVRKQMDEVLKSKGSVFVWISPENLENVNELLPAPVSLEKQQASIIFADRNAPETAAIPLSSLYFQDQSDRFIVKSIITGPLVEKSRILMESNTFTRSRRTYAAIPEKLPVLISSEINGGKLMVTSLLPDVCTDRRLQLIRNLFINQGVKLSGPKKINDNGFDGAGFVDEALVIGSFQGKPYPENMDVDFLKGEASANPKPGDKSGDRTWKLVSPPGDGVYDFLNFQLPGTEGSANPNAPLASTIVREALESNGYLEPQERLTTHTPGALSVAYLSFWIYTPQAVREDDKKIMLAVFSDDGRKIWLNNNQIEDDRKLCGPGVNNTNKIPVNLIHGWNHFMVKVGTQDGLWRFSANLECSDTELLGKLKASATGGQKGLK